MHHKLEKQEFSQLMCYTVSYTKVPRKVFVGYSRKTKLKLMLELHLLLLSDTDFELSSCWRKDNLLEKVNDN